MFSNFGAVSTLKSDLCRLCPETCPGTQWTQLGHSLTQVRLEEAESFVALEEGGPL